MREFLDLANNPLFIRHVRSRLRRSAFLPGAVVVGFFCLCIVFINDFVVKNLNDPNPDAGSQMMFWLQGFVLILLGGSQVAASIAQMKESGIIDFHRITPIPQKVQAIGIMLGAPIRELILYSLTLPFAIYLALDGPIGITNFAKLMLVQLGGAMMYYSLAMITGLTGRRARGASGRFVGVLAALNIGASAFFPMGIYGPTLITSYPVYYEVFIEKAEIQAAIRQNQAQQQMPQGNMAGKNQAPPNVPPPVPIPKIEVGFFGFHPPIVLQTLLFQGSLLTFLFIAAARRIHSARWPLYRKPTALLFFAIISTLTLGSLWDMPTFGLCLGSVYFLTLCAVLLTATVTPALGDVVKGMQRARKMSGGRVPHWTDLSSNKYAVLGFTFILAATVSAGLLLAPQPPNAGIIQLQQLLTPWPPLIVGILTVLSNGFAMQYFGLAYGSRSKSYFVLFIFFAWFVPIIIGILALVAEIEQAWYVLAMSPLVGISMSGLVGFPKVDEFVVKIASITPVAIGAVLFFFLLVGEERRRANRVTDEHSRGGRRDREHEEYKHD